MALSRFALAQGVRVVQEEGMHLDVVRYGPFHALNLEWVYSGTDIDASKVVWAGGMEPTQNHKLLDYFKDRKVWLLEPGAPVRRLTRYPP
jgi:hypothetical protein